MLSNENVYSLNIMLVADNKWAEPAAVYIVKGKIIIKNRLQLYEAEFFSVTGIVNLITKIWLDHIYIKALKR
jgi:hypothetical protein